MLRPMTTIKRRTLILSAAAGAVGASAYAQPARRRRGDEGAEDLRWRDPARDRELPLRLRLPVRPNGALILFSHGLGGSVDAGAFWSQAWAAAGFMVLHLQHPGSDTEALRSGGMRGLRDAADAEQLRARCLDVRFVLDEILGPRRAQFAGLQAERIALAGHSFGAHTTMAVAGQRFGPLGEAFADPRPRAFAAFSPSPGRQGDPGAGFGAIRRPVLCLSGSLDGDPLALGPGAGDERRESGAWRRAVYEALPTGAKAELWLDGADHMTFGGQAIGRAAQRLRRRAEAAVEQAERHRRLIELATTRWWQAQLLGETAALDAPLEGLRPGDVWRRA